MKKLLINKLKSSGLTGREAQIYLGLLQKKEFGASEIASIIPVERTKIYEIIPKLVSKGFCSEIQKDGKKIYRAVEPKIALDNILINYEQELEELSNNKIKLIEDNFQKKKKLIEDNLKKKETLIDNELQKKKKLTEGKKSIIHELEQKLETIYLNNANKTDNLDYIDVIKDKNQIKNKWIELQKNAKYEMLGFSKSPYSIGPFESVKYQKEVLNKKVICRSIFETYEYSTKSSREELLKILQIYSDLGEEIRVIDKLPMKLVIIDEKITMLALNDPVSLKPSITTMIVTHPGFALAQKEIFESYWSKSTSRPDFEKETK